MKAGESRLGKMILEKLGNLFGSEKSSGIEVVLKDSSTKYRNGISKCFRICLEKKYYYMLHGRDLGI